MLPHSTVHWVTGEGHFLVFDHAEEAHATLP
jgi:hypothetical protein